MIEDLEQLAGTLEEMDVGQRLSLPSHVTLRTLWPRPEMPLKDDYLTEMQRAERWLRHFGCVLVEMFDPPGLRIAKESMQAPEFTGFRPGPPPVDERSREYMTEYLRTTNTKHKVQIGDPVEVEMIRSIDQSTEWLPAVISGVKDTLIDVNFSSGDRMSLSIYSRKWRRR